MTHRMFTHLFKNCTCLQCGISEIEFRQNRHWNRKGTLVLPECVEVQVGVIEPFEPRRVA